MSTTCFKVKERIFTAEYTYMIRTILTIISYYFPNSIGRLVFVMEIQCFLRGREWALKYLLLEI
jgi:hypothetical protein